MANLILNGSTSGSVTLSSPAVSGTTTLTLPVQTGTVMVNGPAFSAYGSALQSIPTTTYTKIAYNTEEFDTNSNYDSTTNYRFTPTVAGYYQVNATVSCAPAVALLYIAIYKNGVAFKTTGFTLNSTSTSLLLNTALINFNGSTDYVEIYVYQTTTAINCGSAAATAAFSASMVRSA
jgi:hypothetical protein